MRYIPTLRSPVSGSLVTTQGSVMKRPPSSGQHFWMGRLRRVGSATVSGAFVGVSPTTDLFVTMFPAKTPETAGGTPALPKMSAAFGHGSVRVGGASNLWITSL